MFAQAKLQAHKTYRLSLLLMQCCLISSCVEQVTERSVNPPVLCSEPRHWTEASWAIFRSTARLCFEQKQERRRNAWKRSYLSSGGRLEKNLVNLNALRYQSVAIVST